MNFTPALEQSTSGFHCKYLINQLQFNFVKEKGTLGCFGGGDGRI